MTFETDPKAAEISEAIRSIDFAMLYLSTADTSGIDPSV